MHNCCMVSLFKVVSSVQLRHSAVVKYVMGQPHVPDKAAVAPCLSGTPNKTSFVILQNFVGIRVVTLIL